MRGGAPTYQPTSATRWLNYLSIFGQLHSEICPKQNKPSSSSQSFAKVVKFRQI